MRNQLKIVVLIVTYLSVTLTACKDYSDCTKIRTGKFYYTTKLKRNKVEVYRSDSVQIETDLVTGLVLRSKINWESNCQYSLRIKILTEDNPDSQNQKYVEVPITIKILAVEKEFYTSKALSILGDRKFETIDTFYYNKNYKP